MFASPTARTKDQTLAALRLTEVHRVVDQALRSGPDQSTQRSLQAALAACYRLAAESSTGGLRLVQVNRLIDDHGAVSRLLND